MRILYLGLVLLISGSSARGILGAATKAENAKKPSVAPTQNPAAKTPESNPQNNPSTHDLLDPGFGRKLLDLGVETKKPQGDEE